MAKTATYQRAVYEATEAFVCELGGIPITVTVGATTEEGSELLGRYPQFFRRIRVNYPAADENRVEQATARPGEVRA